jgi:hypothetical protein
MKPTLEMIQSDFQDYVLGTQQDHPAIAASIVEQFGLSAADRLGIYHRAYRLRISEALSKAYDKTHAYLGDDMFEELSLGYIAQHPSQYANMRWVGDQFSAYLAQALAEHPVIAELAAFEWALSIAFDAEDATPLTAQDLAAITPEQWDSVGFALHPSLQILTMHTNAVASWLALDQQQTPPESVFQEAAINWLIWRKELQPHFRSIDAIEAQALRGLLQGQCWSTLCEQIADSSDDEAIMTRIAGRLQTWLVEGILIGVTLTEDDA